MHNHFQIPIFEKGYEKDPAIVAKEAIQEASRNGSDVVLVDTAGRMQVGHFSYYPKLKCDCVLAQFSVEVLIFIMMIVS